jgi:hypothetical protein
MSIMRSLRVRHVIAAAALGLAIAAAVVGAAPAAGLGQPCGGRLGIGCERGLFCDFAVGTCGSDRAEGTCVRVPRFCAQNVTVRRVCGCNGKTYLNDCQRRQAITAKRRNGRC